MTNLFNPAAFFVLLRETLEAAIILSVMLRYVEKVTAENKNPLLCKKLKKDIWIGTIVGLAISIIIGVVFTVIFYVLKRQVFVYPGEALFEGIMFLIALVILTWLALNMISMTQTESKWEKKIQKATEDAQLQSLNKIGYSFMFLAFTVVFREGIESVVFITGVGAGEPESLAIPGALGIIVGVLAGALLYKGSSKFNMKLFLRISSVLILFIAAGIASNAAYELEEYHWKSRYGHDKYKAIAWNWKCCNEKTNGFFQILQAITGYRAKATVASVVSYFTYWAIVILCIYVLRIRNKKKEDLEKQEQAAFQGEMKKQESNETVL